MSNKTPAALGYRMPAEWERHQATWFSWPHNPDTWPNGVAGVERVLTEAVRALCTGEDVHLNVVDATHEAHVRACIDAKPKEGPFSVYYHHIPTNDAWCRDHGALFVVRENTKAPLAATGWGYNAWGEKYPPYDLDQQVPRRMADILKVPLFANDMVLEGGSIEVNGSGMLLTTRACLLNPNRNPGLSQLEIEEQLSEMLGIEKVEWLEGELSGDDTDGHIDNLARFVAPDVVLTVVEDDPSDDNYAPLQDNVARLQRMTTVSGKPLNVIGLPMPLPVYADMPDGPTRLPASYANFYIGNRVVLMPCYHDAKDAVAAAILRRLFPRRSIVGLDCTEVAQGLGAFHCLSQQVPAV